MTASILPILILEMKDKTLRKTSTAARNVLVELLANPDLPKHLERLRELAVYESGDTYIGPDEKEALRSIRSFERKLRRLNARGRAAIRNVLTTETV